MTAGVFLAQSEGARLASPSFAAGDLGAAIALN